MDRDMKIAIWTVTRGAGKLGLKLNKDLKSDLYTLKKFDIENSIKIESFDNELREKFNNYSAHIFIMATGIVIRKVSSLIKGKDVDPAVLVMDEGENFVISLLSGHLGGANELTKKIAEEHNLIPVITTSSDITGKIAVDTISEKLNSKLEDLNSAKDVTSLIVDGKKVNIMLPKNVKFSSKESYDGAIIVSNREDVKITRIFPKNIVVGIGCRRDTKEEDISKAIHEIFKRNNLSLKSVKKFATVDVKEDEVGLIAAVKKLGYNLTIISRKDIAKVEHMFEGSKFVKENIGVSCVSEPSALLASNQNGHFIEKKAIFKGITISIYEEEIENE